MAPSIVFPHVPTFDRKDLFLIVGSALVAQGDFAGAMVAASMIEYSPISQSDPDSWIVDGILYRTFPDVVIAYLAKMSLQHAG